MQNGFSKIWKMLRRLWRRDPEPQDPYSRVRVPLRRGPAGGRSAAVALDEPAEPTRLRVVGKRQS